MTTNDVVAGLDGMLGAFAHELRRPLVTARGWASVLQDDAVEPEVAEGALEELLDTLRRISDRVLDVELVADAQRGPLTLRPSRVAVGDLVAGLDGLDELAGPGGDVELDVDPGLFRRAVRDLWEAGLTAPQPESVRLDVALLPAWLELRVVREGAPVDAGWLRGLLGPATVRPDRSGIDLGLSLARLVAEAHDGAIGVEQTADGAVFWIRISRESSAGPVGSW